MEKDKNKNNDVVVRHIICGKVVYIDPKKDIISQTGLHDYVIFSKTRLSDDNKQVITKIHNNQIAKMRFNEMNKNIRSDEWQKLQYKIKDPLKRPMKPLDEMKTFGYVSQCVYSPERTPKHVPSYKDISKIIARANKKPPLP